MHFPEATREWERLPAASKTWVAWKIKYREAHLERKCLLLANPGGFGGAAHNVINTPAINGYLDNLANTVTNESAKMTSLLAQVQALTASNQALNARIDNLPPPGAAAVGTPALDTSTRTPWKAPVYTQAQELKIFDPTGYCHTHGYWVNKTHNSETCTKQGRKHDKDATRADTKKGSKLNKGWETNPNPM